MNNIVGDPEKLRLLRETGHYLSVPSGKSMFPMLRSRENVVDIVPFDGLLKKYDVALYYRPSDNRCVLHRILKVTETNYIFYGDNCWQTETVPFENVMGVAERFYKKGKWVSVDDRKYLLYVHVWCDFLPIRRFIIRARDAFARKIRGKRKK